jgi:multidrug transporter EmrE-like cation transporter
MTNIVWLSLFSILLASGQLLFKRAAQTIAGLPLSSMAATLAVSGPLWTALLVYGVSTLLWVWILSRIPLSQAYPWVALGSIIVPLGARLLFGEIVEPVFWLGAIMIAAGIVVTQIGSGG